MTADTTTAIKKALEAAEQFIVNGVELGYIRMPEPGTPDSAHQTVPMIRQAQTALESLQRENEELKIDASNHAADAETVRRYRDIERRRADAAEAEVKRLRQKLEPFAKESERWEQRGSVFWSDDTPFPANTMSTLTIGDLRSARAALSSTGDTHGN